MFSQSAEAEDAFINKEKVQKEVKAAPTENATLSCEVGQESTLGSCEANGSSAAYL